MIFKTKIIYEKSKQRLYKVLLLLAILYACERWPIVEENQRKLVVLLKKTSNKIRSNVKLKRLFRGHEIIETI